MKGKCIHVHSKCRNKSWKRRKAGKRKERKAPHAFRAKGLHPNESALHLPFKQETGQGNILLLKKEAGPINNNLRAIIIFLNHCSCRFQGAGSSAKMRLMNSMGVLYESLSPTAGWLSSTLTVLLFPCLHGRISSTNEFWAMPWFRTLVESLCNLRPLL